MANIVSVISDVVDKAVRIMGFFFGNSIPVITLYLLQKFHVFKILAYFPVQVFLVFLYRQCVICMLLFNLFHDFRLRPHGINRYNATLYLYDIQ